MSEAVVILSGGMDSTTVLHKAMREHKTVYALSFDYNQRHKKELDCAKETCKTLNIDHKIVDISEIGKVLLQGSSLTSDVDVPEGHYEAENMKLTVVPNRNMILLSLAAGYAISLKADAIYYGAHAGDHAIYPDCRTEFVSKLRELIGIADWHRVQLIAPYITCDKGDILVDGVKMGVDYRKTWTCYKGLEKACGKCGSCQERLEAFKKIGAEDPLMYEE